MNDFTKESTIFMMIEHERSLQPITSEIAEIESHVTAKLDNLFKETMNSFDLSDMGIILSSPEILHITVFPNLFLSANPSMSPCSPSSAPPAHHSAP